ncbi:hypothetical protein B0H13DRAFT_1873876 [Mycena leptocephala]|nr:hypothetical protein B0H13DRAFT_1873876 [Mycena leptocephala]
MSDTMPPDNPPPSFVVQAPFDAPSADAILSSSDGVDFRTHRIVLSLLSPFFGDMFKLPQPPGDTSIPRLPMAESAVVLDRVLKFCYPGAQSVVDSIDQLRETLEISLIKYDIQGIVPLAKKYLEGYIETHTVAVFAIACLHEWKDLATDAAKISLKLPLRSFTKPTPGLEYIAANRYHSLLQYHAACSAACTTTTKVIRWITAPPQQVWFTCTNCSTNRDYSWYLSDGELWPVRDWLLSYMKAARKAFKLCPLARLDDLKSMSGAVEGFANCSTCRQKGFSQLQSFVADTFGPKIVSVIDTVKLDLAF